MDAVHVTRMMPMPSHARAGRGRQACQDDASNVAT